MIYFCIPAHNEERTVGVVLWKLRQVMAELNRDYQIIVVDDASTDSTPAVLSPYIRVLPLTVIRNSERRGYADSLEVALREAVRRAPYPKRDAVIALQADFTEDPDIVPALVKKIEAGADIVATSVELEPTTPRAYRWGRRLFRWLVRGKEWALFGDPLSGLRAYRVVTLKRALDARGSGRLLSWKDLGANAELLSLTAPHSRRTDVVDTVLKHHRHQRDTRFSFMEALREVRGAAAGKANPRATALPTDGVIATPLPLAVEQHQGIGRGRGRGRAEGTGRERGKGPARPRQERAARSEKRGPKAEQRGPRPKQERKEQPVAPIAPVAAAPGEGAKKKRRRPRRRKEKKQTLEQPQLVVEAAEVNEAVAEGAAPTDGEAPKKKSRRGRRGGRGRRRGARANTDNTNSETQNQGGGDAAPPPPMVAEGD